MSLKTVQFSWQAVEVEKTDEIALFSCAVRVQIWKKINPETNWGKFMFRCTFYVFVLLVSGVMNFKFYWISQTFFMSWLRATN